MSAEQNTLKSKTVSDLGVSDELETKYPSAMSPSILHLLASTFEQDPEDLALDVDSRKVLDHGGTPYINPTAYGRRTHNIEMDEKVNVATFPDCILIWK